MSTPRRLTMNTSLRDANIFDDDEWDDVDPLKPLEIQKKIKNIKQEPTDDITIANINIKQEIIETNIKQEIFENNITNEIVKSIVDLKNVKMEKEHNFDEFSGNSEDDSNSTFESFSTSRSMKRTVDQRDDNFNDSGESPQKKRYYSESTDENKPKEKRRKQEYETNPEVLRRRQKQIDYGKNTIGYDNYISQVPRDKREKDDPQTPNKYVKYSRRAFDGLIKQWRLKLHKYD